MSKGLGKIQRAILQAIELHGKSLPPISTVMLARIAYSFPETKEVADAQMVAVRRALRGLQRKLLVGSHGRNGRGHEQWYLLDEQQRNYVRFGQYVRDRDLVLAGDNESMGDRAACDIQE